MKILNVLFVALISITVSNCKENIVSDVPNDNNGSLTLLKPTDGFKTSYYIPIVVVAYKHTVNDPQRRVIVDDISFLGDMRFNDQISAIRIYKGPDYDNYKQQFNKEPGVTFYQHGIGQGIRVTLGVGEYLFMGDFGANDCFSSVDYLSGIQLDRPIKSPLTSDDKLDVYSVCKIYEASFSGFYQIVINTNNEMFNNDDFCISDDNGFNDKASSLVIATTSLSTTYKSTYKLWSAAFSGSYLQYQTGAQIYFFPFNNDVTSTVSSSSELIISNPNPTTL